MPYTKSNSISSCFASSVMGQLASVITIFGIFSVIQCQIDFDGCHFLLRTPEARSQVKHGDNLTYTFSITLNLSASADNMAVFVNGSNLQVLDKTDLLKTNFTWQTADGRTAEMNSPVMDVEVLKESDLHPVSEIDLQIPLTFGEQKLQQLCGQLELHVADTATLGSLLRPVMYISLFLEQNPVYQTTIFGDYVFMVIPDDIMKVSSAEPRDLEMKETATIMTYLRIPTIPLKHSLLNVYVPRNEATTSDEDDIYANEPYFTVTDFQFIGCTGLSMETSQQISDTNPVYLSSSRTSEVDGVVFSIPEIQYIDTASRNDSYELDFLTEVKSLDFYGAHEGMEMQMVYVLELGDSFFVVRNSSLIVKRSLDVERVPRLNTTLDLIGEETVEDIPIVQYQLKICHVKNVSWSSAYNVSILMYLPPFLHGLEMLRTKDVIKTNTPVENVLHETFIEFKLLRISFIHSVRIQFSLILNTSHIIYEPEEEFTVIVEARYNNWRSQEYTIDILTFPNVFNITAPKENTKVKPLCECLNDRFAQCRCTTENNCKGKIDNVTCVDCKLPWLCVKTLKDYGRACSLNSGSNMSYICGKTKRNRKTWEVDACLKSYNNGTVKRLSPVVGTILGRDINRNDLYGISQNGIAYITSKDEGNTWYNVHPEMYARVLKRSAYETANFE